MQTKKWEIGVNIFGDVIYGWYLIPHRLKTIESSGVAEPQWLDTKFGRFVPLLKVNNFHRVSFVYHFYQWIWTKILQNSNCCHVKNQLSFFYKKYWTKETLWKLLTCDRVFHICDRHGKYGHFKGDLHFGTGGFRHIIVDSFAFKSWSLE